MHFFWIQWFLVFVASNPEPNCVSPTEVQDLQHELSVYKEKQKTWDTNEVNFQQELTVLKQEKDHLKDRLASATTSYEKEIKELQKDAGELVHLKKEVKQCGKEIQTLHQTIEDLTAELKQVRKHLQGATKDYQECTKTLHAATSNEKLQDRIVELEAAIKTCQQMDMVEWLSGKFDEGSAFCKATYEEHYPTLEYHAAQLSTMASAQLSKANTMVLSMYDSYAKETMDPILDTIRTKTNPYMEQYKPMVQDQWQRFMASFQQVAKTSFVQARGHFFSARSNIIAMLQQTSSVAPYAQMVTDLTFLLLASPIVLASIMLCWRILVWMLWCPCRCCCRRSRAVTSKSKSKSKRRSKPKLH